MNSAQLALLLPPIAAVFAAWLGWIAIRRSAARIETKSKNLNPKSKTNMRGSKSVAKIKIPISNAGKSLGNIVVDENIKKEMSFNQSGNL